MGCGSKVAAITLFVFTIVFFLVGAALLAAGIWMLVSEDKLFNVLNLINQKAGNNENVQGELERLSGQKGIVATAGAILIAVGSLSAFISLFGCLGAVRQSKCLLGIYAGFIIAILVAQIAAAVLAVLYKDDVVRHAKSELLALQDKYLVSVNEFATSKEQPKAAISLLFNYMFVYVGCCGVNSTGDAGFSTSWLGSNRTWQTNEAVNDDMYAEMYDIMRDNMTVPAACCPVKPDDKTKLLTGARWPNIGDFLVNRKCPVTGEGSHNDACVDAIQNFISRYSLWVLVGCGVFAAAQLLVIIFTLCLICSINKD